VGSDRPGVLLLFGSLHAGLGRLAMMPLVVLASRICPKVRRLTRFQSVLLLSCMQEGALHSREQG